MTQLLFQQWLPPPVAKEAQRRERALFGNLFRALAEDWKASKDLPPAERSQASLRWISLVNRCAGVPRVLFAKPLSARTNVRVSPL